MNEEKKLTDEEMLNRLELYARDGIWWDGIVEMHDILDLIHRLQGENERLKDEKEEIRLFNLALQNGEVDMRIESEMAKSFYNSIVQVFEQNGAKNFFTTTIDIEGKNGRYAFTIEKVGGQTVAEKLADQKEEIERLTEKYEDKLAWQEVDIQQLTEENAELQKQVDELKSALSDTVKRNEELIEENEQSVKDTAKEILQEIFYEKFQAECDISSGCTKEDVENIGTAILTQIHNKIKEMAKRYGVEVE